MKKKTTKTTKNRAKAKDATSKYVLYGYCKSDIDDVGYLAMFPKHEDDEVISDDMNYAIRFNSSNVDAAVKYANAEFEDMYGPYAFVFHKVKVNK